MNTGLREAWHRYWGDRPTSKLETEFSIRGVAKVSE